VLINAAICNFRRIARGRETAEDVPGQDGGRSRQQEPLKSTLRDIGGCLVVILVSVLIALLVSAAKADAASAASVLRSPWAPNSALDSALPCGAGSSTSLTSARWAAR
jgi:hypothetical protein